MYFPDCRESGGGAVLAMSWVELQTGRPARNRCTLWTRVLFADRKGRIRTLAKESYEAVNASETPSRGSDAEGSLSPSACQ